jgi:HSP20 family molecular chaperone IbpA
MKEKQTAIEEKKTDAVQAETTRDEPVFVPDTDIYEHEDRFTVIADMPGVDQEHVAVSLEDRVLTVEGRTTLEAPEGYDLRHAEYADGRFERSFRIPVDVNTEGIRAVINNGVLRVDIPRAEKQGPRTIKVEAA